MRQTTSIGASIKISRSTWSGITTSGYYRNRRLRVLLRYATNRCISIVLGGSVMADHKVVSHSDWLEARKRHLKDEKEFTRMRDRLSQARRDLPWERIDKDYVFEGPGGRVTLTDLFDGRGQLVIYHAMFNPALATPSTTWTEDAACQACSFWVDNFVNVIVHLNQRDVTLIAASRAPYPKIAAYMRRMGWSFNWVSSGDSDFNFDYGVSFTPDELKEDGAFYNYTRQNPGLTEREGLSVFAKD